MELILIPLGLFIFCSAIVIPWIALVKASGARRIADEALDEIQKLRRELDLAKTPMAQATTAAPEAPATPALHAVPKFLVKLDGPGTPPPSAALPNPEHGQEARATPPPLPAKSAAVNFTSPDCGWGDGAAPAITPPLSMSSSPLPVLAPPDGPPFNWEQFMGAKLFAWVGGLAFFLGVAYFIKYSFDHELVPPAVRAAIGFLAGLALIVGGLRLNREKYAVTQQSLAATGVLVLYAVTFACSSVWKFPVFAATHGLLAFGMMSLITATAFLLAVRLDARVVAVLGIAGGFLTPVLLSTGQDNPVGLFGYIALLDAGLLAVALHRRWHFLAGLGAFGTVLMQMGWWGKFYSSGGYADSAAIGIPMGVFLGMAALFTAAAAVAKRRDTTNAVFSRSALAMATGAMGSAVHFLDAEFLRDRAAIPFAYAFAVEALVFVLAASDKRIRAAGPVAGGAVFLMIAAWMFARLTEANLGTALALVLAFAVVHTAVPLTLKRLGKISVTPGWCHMFPVLALLLALVPAFKYDSMLVWPLLLLVDALAVVLAVAGAILWPLLLVLGLTVLAATGAMLHVGQNLTGLNMWLLMLGVLSVAFIALGVWLWKKFAFVPMPAGETEATAVSGNAAIATLIPPVSAMLPFLLLIMVSARLPLADPSSVFGLALVLSVLLLGLAKLLRLGALVPVGLAGVALLEVAWSGQHFSVAAGNAWVALGWHLGFAALYFATPFVFHRDFETKVAPWLASVASLGVHFLLVHKTVMGAWPHDAPGLHAFAFALPAFAGLALVLKRTPAESPARLAQLALFGGAALAFITLIFPLQCERQWLTIAWAVEGAALCWLYLRVPHNGLRVVAAGLLAAAFARLALNPAVLGYHARGDLPVLNWYLYTYGLAAASFLAAAHLLAPPRHLLGGRDLPALLRAGAVVLGFLLLNIEIADFFSAPGLPVLTFDFSNNLPRDMAYSIAWGLFALALLVIGIVQRTRPARYAAIGLLVVTLGKLFLHDLATLNQLYRIGALMGVAVIAIVASFLYQKFLVEEKK